MSNGKKQVKRRVLAEYKRRHRKELGHHKIPGVDQPKKHKEHSKHLIDRQVKQHKKHGVMIGPRGGQYKPTSTGKKEYMSNTKKIVNIKKALLEFVRAGQVIKKSLKSYGQGE